MNKQYLYMGIFLLSVFISSISQIGLKKAAKKKYESLFYEYCNMLVISSYTLFFIATIITVLSLKYIPLSSAPVLESAGYIFVTILSKLILKEKLNSKKILGMIIIIFGIIIYSIKF